MKVVIFGTGKEYEKNKNRIKKNVTITAFIDNDKRKLNQRLDGAIIYAPNQIEELNYDIIFLMSYNHVDMRQQLHEYGIQDEVIFDITHKGILLDMPKLKIYGDVNFENIDFVVFTHALNSTGANNVIMTLVEYLKKKDKSVVVLSTVEGKQIQLYNDKNIPVIICEDYFSNKYILQILSTTKHVIVNTLWLYYILPICAHYCDSIYWWLHETGTIHNVDKTTFLNIANNSNIHIWSVSPVIDEWIYSTYSDKINIERLLFALNDYTCEKKDRRKNIMIFGCIGGISNIKGQDIFIDAIQLIPYSKIKNVEFWIIGSGNLDDHYKAVVEKNDHIVLTGEIENKKMKEIYSLLDVVVCCSRRESMSVAVVEGCMNEKMSIISDVAGISRYVENKYEAMVYESSNIEQLSKIIEWCIDNPQKVRIIGENSRKVYDNYFTIELFQKRVDALINI